MDTEIHYTYKTKEGKKVHDSVTCDKALYKKYLDLYNADNPLHERLRHCGLIARGNDGCRAFLKDICDFWDASGLDYYGYGEALRKRLENVEIISIEFLMY